MEPVEALIIIIGLIFILVILKTRPKDQPSKPYERPEGEVWIHHGLGTSDFDITVRPTENGVEGEVRPKDETVDKVVDVIKERAPEFRENVLAHNTLLERFAEGFVPRPLQLVYNRQSKGIKKLLSQLDTPNLIIALEIVRRKDIGRKRAVTRARG